MAAEKAQSFDVEKVVAASSMAVYADSAEPVPIDETYPLKPVSPYGVSKQATEMLVRQMCDNAGIDSAVLRLFNTYGSGQALSPYVGVSWRGSGTRVGCMRGRPGMSRAK